MSGLEDGASAGEEKAGCEALVKTGTGVLARAEGEKGSIGEASRAGDDNSEGTESEIWRLLASESTGAEGARVGCEASAGADDHPAGPWTAEAAAVGRTTDATLSSGEMTETETGVLNGNGAEGAAES